MDLLLQITYLRRGFTSWLAAMMRLISQKRNRLAMLETLQLKAGGLTRSAHSDASLKTMYIDYFLPSVGVLSLSLHLLPASQQIN